MYEILPSIKLQTKAQNNWVNSFCTGFILFERTLFCYYSEYTGDMGSRGSGEHTPPPPDTSDTPPLLPTLVPQLQEMV